MKRIFTNLSIALFFLSNLANAQQGVHGPRTVSAANTIVNEYTSVTAPFTAAGSTSITVANSALNANGRFALGLQPGDLIMIMQMQGVVMNNQFSVIPTDTTWGKIVNTGDYYSCGRYEFHQVISVPNATTIIFDCGLTYDYILGAAGRTAQVIRVPRYTALTVNVGGVLTCDDWNGAVGGILAVEVQGNTIINGTVDATAKGFRGGSLIGDNNTQFGVNTTYSTNNSLGAEKGEGVAGYQVEYDNQGGRYCRAPAVNGGGGGDGHNAAGGGGANAPNSTSPTAVWSGNGIPDLSGPSWTAAWNIEPPVNTMSLRTTVNSAGGGRGGYSFSGSNGNAIVNPPGNNAAWGGDSRNHQATGLGGRPLYYGNGRLFLGGGGGAGDQNNLGGGNGGDGGGLIYLMVFGNITGTGTVVSNGQNGFNGQGGTGVITGIDAAGGGGAGGTIVLNAVGGVANSIIATTNGGLGGDQVINLPFSTNEAEGPGGGGGGGYISVSSGSPTRTSNGGNNGSTNSASLTEFTPNGATKGCPGTNNASITNFTINVTPITICVGNSITLTATLGGTPPGGTSIMWYSAAVGGVSLFTGPSYTTPALGSTTTYWVGTCPGWWRVPVTVTVGPAPVVTATTSASPICSGASATLTAGGAVTYNWMPGNINGSPIVVTPASTTTYTVTGTVSAGCTNTATVTVTVNPTPTVTATALPTTICAGSATTLTGGGATSYLWNPGAIAGSPISVTPATTTTYTVTGTSLGCSSTAQVIVTVNPSPTVTAVASSPTICSGNSTTLTGGGAVSYLWNPGAIAGSPISVSPASTTTYTVTGTGGNGCTSTAQVTVTVNPTPTITAVASSPTICSGGSTNLTGGGATSYLWNPGAIAGSPISVSPASTTTYTVTGTTLGCSSTAQVTVTVNTTPSVTATASQTTICAGNSTTLTGGGASTYLWNPGALAGSPISVTPASTTTYTVTGTAVNGCTSTAQIAITVNSLPTVTATATSPTICSGNSTNLTGGGAVSYLWNPGAISGSPISVSPISTTTYTVTGTGVNGCTNTSQVTVTVNPTPTVTATASATTICAGNPSTLTGGGATSYLWNPGAISGSPIVVSPATTTTYTVTGTSVGCSGTAQVTVNVNPTPTVTAVASSPTICLGGSTNLTGGGAVSYLWNPGAIAGSPITVTPITTTTYTITGTAGNGCSGTAQVQVTVNPTPTVTAVASAPTICSGNSTNLTGGGAVSYSWNPGAISGSPISVTPLTTTTYTVTGTGANGCTSTAQVTITVNPTPTVTATTSVPAICVGGSATLTGNGATTYLWNPGSISGSPISVSPIATTTYTVTGTNGSCSSNAQVTVTVNPLPTPTATSTPASICIGQSASLSSTGGVTYIWNGGTLINANGTPQSVSPTTTTTYTVDVTNSNGCSANAQVTLTVNPLPVPVAGADQNICPGNSANLLASGGGTYSWNGGVLVNANGAAQIVTPVATTSYIVTVTNGFGCQQNDTVLISLNPLPATNAGPDVSICPNSSIQLNASGAASYSWSPASGLNFTNISNPIANPLVTTTYVVTGSTALGCTLNDTIVVTVANNLTVFAGADVQLCSGDTIVLSTGGGTIYSWSPAISLQTPNAASTNAFPTVTTTYTVNVTDANACTGRDSITVTVTGPVNLSSSGATTICIGQSTSINATPSNGIAPYTFNWSNSLVGPGPITVTPVTTTNYTVSVTDSAGCTSAPQSILVNVNLPLVISGLANAEYCAGGSTTLTAASSGGDGNYTFTWNPGNLNGATQTLSPLSTTTYTVVVTDGCTTPADTMFVTITVDPLPIVAVQSTTNELCFGGMTGAATLNASGGLAPYTYLWSPTGGSTSTASGLGAGNYSIIVRDSLGCAQTQTLVITEPTLLVTSGSTSPEHCNNADGSASCIGSGGTPGYSYLWSNASTNDSINNLMSGSYSVVTTDANGCTITSTVVVSNTGNANANAGTNVTILSGSSTILLGTGGVTYNWSPATDLSCSNCANPVASPTITTVYILTVTDINGCTGVDTVTVFVDEACGQVFIPNAFSPNGDNANDTLYVRGNCIKYMDFQVYNRWGEKVFSTGNPAIGWDGTWRGQPCEAAVFTYVLRATLNDDTQVDKQGSITIVK